jgi:hypothetical protein
MLAAKADHEHVRVRKKAKKCPQPAGLGDIVIIVGIGFIELSVLLIWVLVFLWSIIHLLCEIVCIEGAGQV